MSAYRPLSNLAAAVLTLSLSSGLGACGKKMVTPVAATTTEAPEIASKEPSKPAEAVPSEALRLVVALENALQSQATEATPENLALFNFDYRLHEVLGELWQQGSKEEKADLKRLSWNMLVKTYERSRHFVEGKEMVRELVSRTDDIMWVQSSPMNEAKTFHWLYRLTREGDTWSITQREFSQLGGQSDTTRFWPVALNHLQKEFGRPVTLRELIANLPKTEGILKARVFQVPEDLNPRKPAERTRRNRQEQ